MLLKQIAEIIAQEFSVKADTITAATKLREDLNIDSLDAVELIMSLEEKFAIAISDSDATQLKTVGDIEQYIRTHKKA